jgi:seryl-tRNA synthetase
MGTYCEQHTDCATKIQEALDSTKSAHKRLDAMEADNKVLHEMAADIKVLATNSATLNKDMDEVKKDVKNLKENPNPEIAELKCDVKELKEKPGKRWDTLVGVIIAFIVSGLGGFLIGKLLGD